MNCFNFSLWTEASFPLCDGKRDWGQQMISLLPFTGDAPVSWEKTKEDPAQPHHVRKHLLSQTVQEATCPAAATCPEASKSQCFSRNIPRTTS